MEERAKIIACLKDSKLAKELGEKDIKAIMGELPRARSYIFISTRPTTEDGKEGVEVTIKGALGHRLDVMAIMEGFQRWVTQEVTQIAKLIKEGGEEDGKAEGNI